MYVRISRYGTLRRNYRRLRIDSSPRGLRNNFRARKLTNELQFVEGVRQWLVYQFPPRFDRSALTDSLSLSSQLCSLLSKQNVGFIKFAFTDEVEAKLRPTFGSFRKRWEFINEFRDLKCKNSTRRKTLAGLTEFSVHKSITYLLEIVSSPSFYSSNLNFSIKTHLFMEFRDWKLCAQECIQFGWERRRFNYKAFYRRWLKVARNQSKLSHWQCPSLRFVNCRQT